MYIGIYAVTYAAMFHCLILLIALFEIVPGFGAESNRKTDKIYCYDDDTNPYRYFASKTPYDVVKGSGIELLGDKCTPVYVWTLMRHPARYGGDECWISARMETIRDDILSNANIQLCERDKQLLSNWKFHGEDNEHADIAIQGKIQLKNFAQRFRSVFRELFDSRPLDENYYEFITSSKPRCADSCVAFAEQFLHISTVSLKDTAICQHDDDLIRSIFFLPAFFSSFPSNGERFKMFCGVDLDMLSIFQIKNKSEKKQLAEAQRFRASDEMQKIIHEISVRLGFEEDLKYEKVYQMYLICAYDYSWIDHPKSAFCAAFEPHHLQVFEYLFDLIAYHARGYGNSDNTYLGEELVHTLIDRLRAAAQNENDNNSKSKLASFYFAHSHTIVPFLKQFDLFNDNEPLTKDNFTKMKNRKFRASRFDPFCANIVIVLFKCENETKIEFYMNEQPLRIPDFDGNVCTLAQLEEKFKDILSNSKSSRAGNRS